MGMNKPSFIQKEITVTEDGHVSIHIDIRNIQKEKEERMKNIVNEFFDSASEILKEKAEK